MVHHCVISCKTPHALPSVTILILILLVTWPSCECHCVGLTLNHVNILLECLIWSVEDCVSPEHHTLNLPQKCFVQSLKVMTKPSSFYNQCIKFLFFFWHDCIETAVKLLPYCEYKYSIFWCCINLSPHDFFNLSDKSPKPTTGLCIIACSFHFATFCLVMFTMVDL